MTYPFIITVHPLLMLLRCLDTHLVVSQAMYFKECSCNVDRMLFLGFLNYLGGTLGELERSETASAEAVGLKTLGIKRILRQFYCYTLSFYRS